MAASNRLYEEKLGQMGALRTKVQTQIALRQSCIDSGKREDAEALDSAIDGNLAILRDLISEGSMFANEAYLTDGGINHVVVGLQSKIEISQTRYESMDAFNENVADSLKESRAAQPARRRGRLQGRQVHLAHGGRREEHRLQDQDIAKLYDVGFKLANEIKGGDATSRSSRRRPGGDADLLGATPLAGALMAYSAAGARVARAHQAELAERGQDRAAPVKAAPSRPSSR